ncbi:hypothetical protein HHI36_017711 [Cryptolaemus montrouzieri]|uniref:Uncharacterized protein n=1 Tax=Cryptolaemus montrouzieri TaxID=559131 RepID=A0ABD2NPB8_9CUCU
MIKLVLIVAVLDSVYSELQLRDRKYNIPPLNPLEIPSVPFLDIGGFDFNTTAVSVHGIADAVVTDLEFNALGRKVSVTLTCPNLTLDFDYDVKGNIGNQLIGKQGHGTIEIYNGTYTYGFHFEVNPVNSKLYLKIKKDSILFDAEKIAVDLSNVEFINRFLSRHWMLIQQEFGLSIEEGFRNIIRTIVGNIMKKISVENNL